MDCYGFQWILQIHDIKSSSRRWEHIPLSQKIQPSWGFKRLALFLNISRKVLQSLWPSTRIEFGWTCSNIWNRQEEKLRHVNLDLGHIFLCRAIPSQSPTTQRESTRIFSFNGFDPYPCHPCMRELLRAISTHSMDDLGLRIATYQSQHPQSPLYKTLHWTDNVHLNSPNTTHPPFARKS